MPAKDKRKLAAIMFADVVGYSRMMAGNEERTLELLRDFENICSPIISENSGEIIKKVVKNSSWNLSISNWNYDISIFYNKMAMGMDYS